MVAGSPNGGREVRVMYQHRFVVVIAVAALMIGGGLAAEEKALYDKDAQAVANRAFADLAAWRNDSAKKYLEKNKGEYGGTPAYQAAWALLEIQEGSDGNKAKTTKALNSLSDSSKSGSFSAAALYYKGEVLHQQNDRKGAEAAWQAALNNARSVADKDPTDATAQYYLGAALVRAKKFAEARDALLIAVRAGFDPAMVNYQIGLSYLFGESWDQARAAFDLGLAVDPRFAPMYFWRAMAWDKLGRKDSMLLDLDQYLKLAPNGPEAGKARAVLKSAGR